jgi:PhnB protein
MAAKPGTVTPYLAIAGAARAIEFYKRVFGAEELMRLADDSGKVQHAEIALGESVIMLADEFPDIGFLGPASLGGARPPVILSLRVDNADQTHQAALAAGATSIREPKDEFYGERTAQIQDPFGHVWFLMQPIEEVSSEEVTRRFEAMKK